MAVPALHNIQTGPKALKPGPKRGQVSISADRETLKLLRRQAKFEGRTIKAVLLRAVRGYTGMNQDPAPPLVRLGPGGDYQRDIHDV